jgi:hypothetical protein
MPSGGSGIQQAPAQRRQRSGRPADQLDERIHHQPAVARFRFGHPQIIWQRARVRRAANEDLSQLDGIAAIEHREVCLGDDCMTAVCQTVQQVELPEWPASIQRSGLHSGAELGQLLLGTRLGQRGATDVIFDVECPVVDPDRIGEIAGDTTELLPVSGHQRDAVLDEADHTVMVEPITDRPQQGDAANVHRCLR